MCVVHIHLPRISWILSHVVGGVMLHGEWYAMVPAYDGVNLLTELGQSNAVHAQRAPTFTTIRLTMASCA
mgnify:CR=1 FL=1